MKQAALCRAAFEGDLSEVARLLDEGVPIDGVCQLGSALHAAIEGEQIECVRLLLSRGANVELRERGDFGPLEHAVDSSIDGTIQGGGSPGDEPVELIALLVEAGADVEPALALARKYQSGKVIATLTQLAARRGSYR